MQLSEKNTPLVTILICNYNYAQYLRDAIDSALNQTWQNLEVIVVDDGSTDESREILDGFQGKIKTILKENGGQASAFNVGVAAAEGDIICFLDSDDIWRPEKVSAVVRKYTEGDYGLVCHDLELIDGSGQSLGKLWTDHTKVSLAEGEAIKFLVERNYVWFFSPTAGMSLLKTVAEKIFPLNENKWKIGADTPLAYMAACLAPIGVIDESLGFYRLHGLNGFASFHDDMVAQRIAGVTYPAIWYYFTLDFVDKSRHSFLVSPKHNYLYYRRCCLVARKYPWHYLPSLWRRNIIYHMDSELNIFIKVYSIVKYFISDTVVVAGIFFSLPIAHQRYRRRFINDANKLNSNILHFILEDEAVERL